MKISTDRSVLDRIPAQRKANYHINPAATIHITRILRNMYQDPVRAVVREYLSNAIDVHRQFGVKPPIEISNPNRFTQTFSVRDFGPGLSVDEVETLLIGYGSSGDHKRESDNQIGGFGIGCKCAFAVSDTFTYTSWNHGTKQTWICSLDNKDMGQAKLISNEPSDEPSGLKIEIPVRDQQLEAFARQVKLATTFVDLSVKVDAKVIPPKMHYDVRLKGPLNGAFKGSEWQFLKYTQDNVETSDLIAVMGDMWYPIDPEQVKGLDASKLHKVLEGGDGKDKLFCAFRVPISSLSIAPTREGLQYDAHTCTSLKHLVKDVDRVLQDQAENMIEQADTQFDALAKAFELCGRQVYTFPYDKERGPYIKWQGKSLFMQEHFAIPAAPHKSGATLILASRDTYERNGGHSHGYRSYGAPTASKLGTHHTVLTQEHKISKYPGASIMVATKLSELIEKKSPYRQTGFSSGLFTTSVGAAIPIIAYATSGRHQPNVPVTEEGQTHAFIFLRGLKLYHTIPGIPVLHYTRQLLKAQDSYAPQPDGMCLVLSGTDTQRAAFLADYPWLVADVNDIEQLPVKESAIKRALAGAKSRTGGTLVRKRPNYELFKFNEIKSTSTPSENWDRVPKADLPTDKYLGLFMSRMNPVPVRKPIDGIQPGTQFNWLKWSQQAMELMTGSLPEVFGLRLYMTHEPKIPEEFSSYHTALKEALAAWTDPATIGDYPVHGSQLLLRFGFPNSTLFGGCSGSTKNYSEVHNGLFFHLVEGRLPLKLSSKLATANQIGGHLADLLYLPHMVHMMDCVRIPASWEYIKANCDARSQLRQMGELFNQVLGAPTKARETELSRWYEVFDALFSACARTQPRAQHMELIKPTNKRVVELTKHYAPVEAMVRKTWARYSCFRLFEDVPVEGDLFQKMMQYVHVIDKQ